MWDLTEAATAISDALDWLVGAGLGDTETVMRLERALSEVETLIDEAGAQ